MVPDTPEPDAQPPTTEPHAPHDEQMGKAIVGGVLAALIGGVAWALIVIYAHLEVGWIAWGIGLLVGLAMASLTPARGQAVATLAALLAATGLVVGKSLIVAVGARPGFAREIKADSVMMAQAALQDLRARKALPAEIQTRLGALAFDDTLPDALWEEMVAAGAAHAATLGEAERERVAASYADLFLDRAGFMQILRGQLGPWDLLWFGLAVVTAWRIMASRPIPKEATP